MANNLQKYPHVSTRNDDTWPRRNKAYSGWLAHTEYNLMEKYIRNDITSAAALADWSHYRVDHAMKIILMMVEAGLLTGTHKRYKPTGACEKLFKQTENYILTLETGELMNTVVIGDIHARWDKFKQLMVEIGAMDAHGNRMAGFRFIQLGDAVSLGYGEKESDFYSWFMDEWMREEDVCLVGNHELPAIYKNYNVEFQGWSQRDVTCQNLVMKYWDEGRLKAAASYEGYLLTHAGLSARQISNKSILNLHKTSPKDLADFLNREFFERVATGNVTSYHNDICVGVDTHDGGIFWCRPSLRSWSGYVGPKQMFGHTPIGPVDVGREMVNKWGDDMAPIPDGTLTLLDTSSHKDLDTSHGRRPSQDMFGGVACAVFEEGTPAPTIHVVEAG